MTLELVPFTCPCGYVADMATPIGGDATPAPGDIGVCIACGGAHEFVAVGGRLERIGMAETAIPAEARPMVKRIRDALRRRKARWN